MPPEAVVFDTHRFVKNLTANGFTEQQAEALARETVEVLNGNLATRADLALLKSELLKWILGAMLAQTGLIAALILALVGLR